MSWDVFVQDLPGQAESIEDIPQGFQPQPVLARARIAESDSGGSSLYGFQRSTILAHQMRRFLDRGQYRHRRPRRWLRVAYQGQQ
jgi:hypothetical protein